MNDVVAVHVTPGKDELRTRRRHGVHEVLLWQGKFAFQGVCHACGYTSHSQKYCPLRACHLCKQWGHMSSVCPSQVKTV
jgi:hypothetical protein